MIEGDFFHNFNIFLFKTDRVSHGQFVSIFKPIDKYREKSYTVLFYRGADKSLARPTSRCILFDGENISFDASLVIYIYIYIFFPQCHHMSSQTSWSPPPRAVAEV